MSLINVRQRKGNIFRATSTPNPQATLRTPDKKRPQRPQYVSNVKYTVNPLLSPPGGLFFSSIFEGGGFNREGGLKEKGGLFNLAKHITCSKNTVVSDRVDLRVVQFKSLSKVFDSLVVA